MRISIVNIIDKLKQIREEKKLSYLEMAKQIGMDEQLLIMLELGEIKPSQKMQEQIETFIFDSI